MAKINLAITVDNHVNTWLNEQPYKRSTLINRILNEYMREKGNLPRKRRGIPPQHIRKQIAEENFRRLEAELDALLGDEE
tara:strand:+ start:409 stop:648 length:240 start_codon:yes stop_codon:yes gene_type:complete